MDKANYFTFEVYGARARACAEHLGKGSRIVVDAELEWREWTDQQSNRREAVTLRAHHVLFEGAKPSERHRAGDEADGRTSSADTEPVGSAVSGHGSATADDIPF